MRQREGEGARVAQTALSRRTVTDVTSDDDDEGDGFFRKSDQLRNGRAAAKLDWPRDGRSQARGREPSQGISESRSANPSSLFRFSPFSPSPSNSLLLLCFV
ncbi:hypothetical protein MRX96_057938 [Rhipicephalus microplus]